MIKEADESKIGFNSNEFVYRNKETLVTSTKEFIRNIIRDCYKKYKGVRLAAKRDHILTL